MKYAVVEAGGKQYLVKENDELYIDRLDKKADDKVEFKTLMQGDFEKGEIEIGSPFLESKVVGKILENLKGDKIRVLRFKAKVRYHKTKGFREYLSKVKIIKI